MKFVLVDKLDNITDRGDFSNKKEANNHFISRKQIEEGKFNKLWKVMTEEHYDTQKELAQRQGSWVQYEWWKEEDAYLDGEKS